MVVRTGWGRQEASSLGAAGMLKESCLLRFWSKISEEVEATGSRYRKPGQS
jgi:hypothetical protein